MNRDTCEHFVPTDLHCDHCADKSSTPSLEAMNSDEALRLANELESGRPVTGSAAAELRRLHEENENTMKHFNEAVEAYKVMAAQRDALLEALKQCQAALDALWQPADSIYQRAADAADRAIAKAEENT